MVFILFWINRNPHSLTQLMITFSWCVCVFSVSWTFTDGLFIRIDVCLQGPDYLNESNANEITSKFVFVCDLHTVFSQSKTKPKCVYGRIYECRMGTSNKSDIINRLSFSLSVHCIAIKIFTLLQ